MTQRIIKKWSDTGKRTDRVKSREKDIMLRLRLHGKTIEEIASNLKRNPRTVWKHLQKQDVISPTEASPVSQILEPIITKALEKHLSDIRNLIEKWKNSITTPDIGSSPFDFYIPEPKRIEKHPLFSRLPDHISCSSLWQDYALWKNKLNTYLVQGWKLRHAIGELAECWEGVKSFMPDFAVPILEHINLKAHKITGLLHGCSTSLHGEGNSLQTLVVDGYPVLIASATLDCVSQYQTFSTQILASNDVDEIIASFHELEMLEKKIHGYLETILLRYDYFKNRCNLCPG